MYKQSSYIDVYYIYIYIYIYTKTKTLIIGVTLVEKFWQVKDAPVCGNKLSKKAKFKQGNSG